MNRLYILGDSTAAIKREEKRPETGWGEKLSLYLGDRYDVVDRALNGRSTRSFIEEGLFDEVLQSFSKDDLALIEFGHNDEKAYDSSRYAAPFTDYADNLFYMANELLKRGGKVILLTPIPRRSFINGVLKDTHGQYPAAVFYAAYRAGVPVIDMTLIFSNELSRLGDEGSKRYFLHLGGGVNKNYPDGIADNTHLNEEGARHVASLIAEETLALLAGASQRNEDYFSREVVS